MSVATKGAEALEDEGQHGACERAEGDDADECGGNRDVDKLPMRSVVEKGADDVRGRLVTAVAARAHDERDEERQDDGLLQFHFEMLHGAGG